MDTLPKPEPGPEPQSQPEPHRERAPAGGRTIHPQGWQFSSAACLAGELTARLEAVVRAL